MKKIVIVVDDRNFFKNYFIMVVYCWDVFYCILYLMINIYDWYWFFIGLEKYCIKMVVKV